MIVVNSVEDRYQAQLMAELEKSTQPQRTGAAMTHAYGTAIRKRKSKRILDVDLSFDRDEAERLVAQQNAKKAILASRVEWVVVEIRALEPGDPS